MQDVNSEAAQKLLQGASGGSAVADDLTVASWGTSGALWMQRSTLYCVDAEAREDTTEDELYRALQHVPGYVGMPHEIAIFGALNTCLTSASVRHVGLYLMIPSNFRPT